MRRGRRHGPTRSDRRGLKVVVLVLGSKSSSKAAKVLYWAFAPASFSRKTEGLFGLESVNTQS